MIILDPTGNVELKIPASSFDRAPLLVGTQNVWADDSDGTYARVRSMGAAPNNGANSFSEPPASTFEPLTAAYPAGILTRISVKARVGAAYVSNVSQTPALACEVYRNQARVNAYDSEFRRTNDITAPGVSEVEWRFWDATANSPDVETLAYYQNTPVLGWLQAGVIVNFYSINSGFNITSYDSSFEIYKVWIEIEPDRPAIAGRPDSVRRRFA